MPLDFAPANVALVRIVPEKFTFARMELLKLALVAFEFVKLAPVKSEFANEYPNTLAPVKLALVKLSPANPPIPFNRYGKKSALEKSAPERFTPSARMYPLTIGMHKFTVEPTTTPPEITPVSVVPQKLVPVKSAPFKFAPVKSAPGPTKYPFAITQEVGSEIGFPISFEERIPFKTELAKFVLEMFVPDSKLFDKFAELRFKFERSIPDKSAFVRSELDPSR